MSRISWSIRWVDQSCPSQWASFKWTTLWIEQSHSRLICKQNTVYTWLWWLVMIQCHVTLFLLRLWRVGPFFVGDSRCICSLSVCHIQIWQDCSWSKLTELDFGCVILARWRPWRDFMKKPKAPSFQIGSGWNLAEMIESDIWFADIISKWWPWRHFTQDNAVLP